eukprot:3075574-Pleurochrysis_carterae.AAC.1
MSTAPHQRATPIHLCASSITSGAHATRSCFVFTKDTGVGKKERTKMSSPTAATAGGGKDVRVSSIAAFSSFRDARTRLRC